MGALPESLIRPRIEALLEPRSQEGSTLPGMKRSLKMLVSGRPRFLLDFALILHFREIENLSWTGVAREYAKRTGQGISPETCRRRYNEAKQRINEQTAIEGLMRK